MESALYPANQIIKERYTPYRVENGQRLPFETVDYRPLLAPFDHELIASIGFMSENEAFENLRTLKKFWAEKQIPLTHERIAILKRAAHRLDDKKQSFADLIAWEGGKPLKDARVEVARAIQALEWAAEEAGRMHGEEIPMSATAAASGHIAFTTIEPIGVVFAISAFNHPLNLIIHQVAPALAVGCPVMIKPALETPLTCLHFLDLLYEAGLPVGMCLPLVCDNAVAEKIARSAEISFLSFIGSSKVGWHLRSVLAPGTHVALEHGGAAPVIVDRSANLEQSVASLLRGGYYHSGQVCVSVQRIFVHEEIADEFEKKFVSGVRKLQTGNPRHEATDCGPIIRRRDLERIHSLVTEAISLGAQLLIGGKAVGSCYEPTVLRDPPLKARVMTEEVFGPVVCLQPFRDIGQAIEFANCVEWRFQAAIYSQDLNSALQAARHLNASAVMVNESTTFRVDWMPFRGDGPSGLGTGGIGYAMKDLTRKKMLVFKLAP